MFPSGTDELYFLALCVQFKMNREDFWLIVVFSEKENALKMLWKCFEKIMLWEMLCVIVSRISPVLLILLSLWF